MNSNILFICMIFILLKVSGYENLYLGLRDELVFLLDWYYGIWCDDEGSEN